MSSPTLAFVVPARNAAAHLPRCLGAIARAAERVGPCDVVVVDNGSRDDSARLAAGAGARVVPAPGVRVGAVRNTGARATRASIIAFVDADNEIAPEWAAACLDVFTDPSVAAAGLPYSAPQPPTWVQAMYDLLRFRPATRVDVSWLGAGNLAVRRDAFESAGGFDERLEACEDVALCFAIEQSGRRLVAEPGMRSVHHGDPATLKALFVGELWRGRDNLRVTLRGRWSAWLGIALPIVSLFLVAALATTALLAPWTGWLAPPALAFGGLVAIALVRTAVIIRRGRLWQPRQWLQSLAVAFTFELARAFALLGGASHAARTDASAA